MFTESVRVGCSFPSCRGGSAKYQTCLIFHRASATLHRDCGSAHLELGADIQRRREEREAREREEAQQKQQREEARRKEARVEESHSEDDRQPEKRLRTERSVTETEAVGGEVGPSQLRSKKGHMTISH